LCFIKKQNKNSGKRVHPMYFTPKNMQYKPESAFNQVSTCPKLSYNKDNSLKPSSDRKLNTGL